MALASLVCVIKRQCLFHRKILLGNLLYCQTKCLTALPKSMAATMDRVKSPWRNWRTDVLFTSPTPVINVVMALRCKFIMISCTLDPANTGPSKWHQLLRSKQARAGAKFLARCHQNTLQKLLLLTSSNMMRTTRQAHLTAQTARLLTECVECQKTRVVYGRSQLSEWQKTMFAMLLSQLDYTCGSHITPPSHSLHGIVVVRMDINCSNPVEASFYSSALGQGNM